MGGKDVGQRPAPDDIVALDLVPERLDATK